MTATTADASGGRDYGAREAGKRPRSKQLGLYPKALNQLSASNCFAAPQKPESLRVRSSLRLVSDSGLNHSS